MADAQRSEVISDGSSQFERFRDLAKRLVAVPKEQLDESREHYAVNALKVRREEEERSKEE